MATYVVSDIHGYFYRFQDCLAQVNFDPKKDNLYILGDLCDRGPNNDKMLEWAYNASNSVKFLLGNHEDMMLSFFKHQEHFTRHTFTNFNEDYTYEYSYNSIWFYNGGFKTCEYLMHDIPRVYREDILKWIESWPLYYDITVQGRRFLLVHAGLAMNGMRMGDDFLDNGINIKVEIPGIETPQHSQSLLWVRENWFLNNEDLPCDVIFGHTPTAYINQILEDFNEWSEIDGEELIPIEKGKEILHFGKGLKKHAIDTGRECMSILRLEDMREWVSDIEENDSE